MTEEQNPERDKKKQPQVGETVVRKVVAGEELRRRERSAVHELQRRSSRQDLLVGKGHLTKN